MRQLHGRVSETGLPIRREKRMLHITYLLHCDIALQHNKFEFRSGPWSDPAVATKFRAQGPEKGPSGPYVSQT